MLHFHWPVMFLALPLPWLLRSLLPPARQTNSGCLYAPFATNLPTATNPLESPTTRWHQTTLLLIWLLLVTAAARPQWLGDPVTLHESGRSIMLAIDVSGSMGSTDLDPAKGKRSRLDVVKRLAAEFIARRHGDRIGLILFGSNAYLQAPLTFDRDTVRELLAQAMIGIAGRETAIGNAVGLAIKRLRDADPGKAVLILVTDGANTAGVVSPRRAAQFAAGSGLKIYTIGVGATGAHEGDPATELDETLLRDIAATTGGRYFRATDLRELREIYHLLDRLEPVVGATDIVRPVHELYPWPLGAALLLSFALAAPTVTGTRP